MDSPESIPPEVYDSLLIAEAAGKLPPEPQQALNTLRQSGAVPEIQWQPDHPHIQAAEQQYGLPKGFLSALLPVENGGTKQYAPGSNDATSPTAVKGLFQVTLGTGAKYGLTPDNRTNPYVETDVAAQLAKDLLAQNGNSIKGALHAYKGQGPLDAPDSVYFDKFAKNFQRYGGDPNLLKDRADAGYKPVNLGFEPQAPAGSDPNLVREDGTLKGHGWLGDLQTPDGRVASEISISVPIHGHETLIPQLVPTLAPDEVNLLVGGGKPTPAMTQKAIAFAKQRIAAGKSPFAQPGEYGGNAQGVQEPFAPTHELPAFDYAKEQPPPPSFWEATRGRAGFATPQYPTPNTGNGLYSVIGRGAEKLNEALGGVPGQTLSNLSTGPMGPMLKMAEIPAAAGGTAVERATGSPAAGTAAQLLLDVLVPKIAAEGGSRLLGATLPENAARTLVPRAAARNDLAAASTIPQALQSATKGTPDVAGDLMKAGLASQADTGAALKTWRQAKSQLFQHVETLTGDAPVVDSAPFQKALTDTGMATATEDGLSALTTGLGLTPKGKAALEAATKGPLTFADARTLQTELGNAAFRNQKVIGTPSQGIAKALYSGISSGVEDFLASPEGAEAAPALAEAKQAYRTGKLLFNESARRLVVGGRSTPKAPESVVTAVFKPGNVTDTLDYKQLVGDDTYQHAVQAWQQSLAAKAGGAQATPVSLYAAYKPYLTTGHLETILPPEQASAVRQGFARWLDATNHAESAANVLKAPTKMKKTLGIGKALVKPIAYGAGGAAAYRAFNSK